MGNFNSVCALLGVGVMSAGSTVDAKLQRATDSSGTGAKGIFVPGSGFNQAGAWQIVG